MDLKTALRSIRKHWIVVSLAALLGLAGGGYLAFTSTAKYQSSLAFFVSATTTSGDASQQLAGSQFVSTQVNTYVDLASSQKLAEAIIADTNVNLPAAVLAREISASAALNTSLINIKVIDPVKPRSLVIAQALSTEYPKYIGEVDPNGKARLAVTTSPHLSPYPVRSSRSTTLLLGLVAGLFVGIMIAILRELLDNTIRSEETLQKVTDHPVLGSVSYDSAVSSEPLLVGRQSRSLRAEAFRQLRTNLQFMNVDRPNRVIVVTSPVAGEGKSTTSANLAIVFAETGRATLLIEADMRRPRVTEYLGLERAVGLSNVLAGQVQVDEVLQRWGEGNLSVLSGGTVPPNPSEMLGSKGMADLVTSLRDRFDMIVIDTPPLLPVTDAAVASVHADGVVVIVRSGKTTRGQLTSALATLDAVDAPILGTVLNMSKLRSAARGGYDGYGYYEHPRDTPVDLDGKIHVASSSTTDSTLVGSGTAHRVRRDDSAEVASPPSEQTAPQRRRRADGSTVGSVWRNGRIVEI